ncbi:hypothetical protein D3C81_1345840 [compost metagenome]
MGKYLVKPTAFILFPDIRFPPLEFVDLMSVSISLWKPIRKYAHSCYIVSFFILIKITLKEWKYTRCIPFLPVRGPYLSIRYKTA